MYKHVNIKNYIIAEAERVRMHCWLVVILVPSSPSAQSLFCRAFPSAGLQPALVHGAISPQVGDFLFLFIKCHETLLLAISITTEVSRKEFCYYCHWIFFYSPDWFVLSLFKQMPNNSMCEELLTHEVKSDFRPGEETGESLTWESLLPFLEENLGYLHYVVKVES